MRYFAAIIIVICAGLTLSGTQPVNISADFATHADEESTVKNFSEITCESGQGAACVENITFPAMHIRANVEK